MNEHLFKIDFNTWSLPKNPESGLLTEPVATEVFDSFEYWSDQFNKPVRQIICKDNSRNYADYLDLDTATLKRQVSSMLGVSAYDDEIDKKQYEQLCQLALLRNMYKKEINYEILNPFQSMSLDYYSIHETMFISKGGKLYEVDFEKQILEKTTLTASETTNGQKISAYEYYYTTIKLLIKKNGVRLPPNKA